MLTIIIASYNHEKYILDCLSEAIKIDILGKKIIVIDDGSTDNTIKKVTGFIETNHLNNQLQLIQKKNSGLVNSLNLGLNLTQTPYFYLTASDDIPNPQGIKRLFEQLESKQNAGFIIGGAINFFEDGTKPTPTYSQAHNQFFDLVPKKQYDALFLNYPQPLLLQSTLFKTSIIKGIGGWDLNLKLDDYSLFIKLIKNHIKLGIKTEFLPTVICCYYRHHSLNSYKNVFNQYNLIYQTLITLCPSQLLNRALGVINSHHLYTAIKHKDYKALMFIVKKMNFAVLAHTFISLLKIARKKYK